MAIYELSLARRVLQLQLQVEVGVGVVSSFVAVLLVVCGKPVSLKWRSVLKLQRSTKSGLCG